MIEASGGLNIFIVEDNLEMSRMYERAFRLRGYEVEMAYDGETALQVLEAANPVPDAIILDIMIPHINGAAVLQRLRSNPRFLNVSIAVLTNSFYKDQAEYFLELGADLYLVKIDNQSKQIVDQIEALISNKRNAVHHE